MKMYIVIATKNKVTHTNYFNTNEDLLETQQRKVWKLENSVCLPAVGSPEPEPTYLHFSK